MNAVFPYPAWVVMWAIALGLYAVGKGASLWVGDVGAVPMGRKVAYWLLFPGMNARGFCTAPARGKWSVDAGIRYVANAVVGAAVVWVITRHVPGTDPLVRGWVGMFGLIMMLHFGVLQLASLAWRAAGR